MRIVTVPSMTDPNKKYSLKVEGNEAQECNCFAFLARNPMRKPCKHIVDYNRKNQERTIQ